MHPKFGVYLGSAQGRGYWSKVDSVGQPAAVTFPSQQEAHRLHGELGGKPAGGCELLPVVSDGPGYATIAACVRAGAPAWLDPLTPTANGRAQAMCARSLRGARPERDRAWFLPSK